MVSSINDYSLEFTGSERVEIRKPMDDISKEITISFWQYGASNLPVNSTIFEGRDNANRRQVNVHLPWGNSQVYWDCGNNGSGYDRINLPALPFDFNNPN